MKSRIWVGFWLIWLGLGEMLIVVHSSTPLPQSVEPSEELNQEAQVFAQREFETCWTKNGESWFTKEKEGGKYWQVNKIVLKTGSQPISKIDQLNGVSWRGFIDFSSQAQRIYFPDQGWSEWIPGSFASYQLVRKQGRWKIISSAGSAFSKFKHNIGPIEKDIVKPGLNEILQILNEPHLSEEESTKLLADLMFGGSTAPDTRPQIISQSKPGYTEAARHNKIAGKVVLLVEFRADGTIGEVQVVRSLGYGLDECAVEVARQIRFRPAQKGGIPVTFRSRVEYSFHLT
ncbi:MAG TPA: energy transducer TonB [Acidobacteriota bacterium]|nr:energy transducer TonB [Acidobacteriota bacterium]